jgi:hypothetical protein
MPSGKFDGGAAELNLWCPAGSPAPAGALAHAFARGRNRAAADRGEARSRLNNQGWGSKSTACSEFSRSAISSCVWQASHA